ncbi:MAG TPA: cutinase family protein [Mycobacteriales bacterium]|jgi:cutinase|nr:cutinase family protein [Mycobacteriales bacterium]
MRAAPSLRLLAPLLAATTAVAGTATLSLLTATPAAAACADVDVSFARGTGEAPGLGIVGGPFVSSLTAALPGRTVSTYAVNYAANTAQTSAGPGATDLTNHVTSVAAACPGTQFVLGGYSQGASVVDIALGIRTGTSTGTALPAALSGRVAAVVVFGNPLGLQRQTIATASRTYGARSRDYCNTGDPVCGNGFNFAAHLTYASNGSTAAGAAFAAGLVATTTTPTPPPPPAAPVCVRASTSDQVDAGRASEFFGRAYAVGSRDYLGYESRFVYVSLRQTSPTSWSRVDSC